MAIDKAVDSAALNSMFTAIANAIRGKNGETAQYTPAQMAEAIAAIEAGGGVPSNVEYYEITPTETGIITVTTDVRDAIMAVCFLPLQGVGNIDHVNDNKMTCCLTVVREVSGQNIFQGRVNPSTANTQAGVLVEAGSNIISNTSKAANTNKGAIRFVGNSSTNTRIVSLGVYAGGTYGMILGATYHLLLFRSGVNW